ncbi:MAG: HlyD family efflux transporter periplasmic adaptor subunit [Ruminococcus sp.]
MDNLLFKRILVSVLILAIVAYVGFLFFSANFGRSIEIESAIYAKTADTIRVDGFIVRNEKYITNNRGGVLSYKVENGDNVSAGQSIADIYANENDAVAQQKIKNINKQITNLQNLGKFYYKESVGLDTINNEIDNQIFTMLSNVNKRKLAQSQDDTNNLLYYINEKQIITGQVKSFKNKINDLRAEREDISKSSSSKIGSVQTGMAGYYVSDVDGYEKSINYNKVKDVSVKDLKKVSKSSVRSDVIGKIVVDPEWFILCEIDKDQAIALSKVQGEKGKVSVSIPFISKENIVASIYSINQGSKSENAVLVLSCDMMSKDISAARKETIEINTTEFSGLKISKRAIHEDYVEKQVKNKDGVMVTKRKKVQGVYVLSGSELLFKEINIVYSSKQYVLCNPKPDEKLLFNGVTVQLYDQVVIKGDNLYHGKVIA